MKRTRLIRVDVSLYNKIKKIAKEKNMTITDITRSLSEVLSSLDKLLFKE